MHTENLKKKKTLSFHPPLYYLTNLLKEQSLQRCFASESFNWFCRAYAKRRISVGVDKTNSNFGGIRMVSEGSWRMTGHRTKKRERDGTKRRRRGWKASRVARKRTRSRANKGKHGKLCAGREFRSANNARWRKRYFGGEERATGARNYRSVTLTRPRCGWERLIPPGGNVQVLLRTCSRLIAANVLPRSWNRSSRSIRALYTSSRAINIGDSWRWDRIASTPLRWSIDRLDISSASSGWLIKRASVYSSIRW